MFHRSLALGLLLCCSAGVARADPSPMADEPAMAMPASPLIQAFVQAAGTGNQFEMTTSQMALEKSSDPAVLRFAQRMLTDHHAAELALDRAAAHTGVVTHFMFSTTEQAKIDALDELDGQAFDKAYWAAQQETHAAAVSAVGNYAAAGEDPALRAWARETLPVIRSHERMLAAAVGPASLAME